MPEGQSLCLLKLVPRIPVQTCCLSTSYILVRVSTYRNNIIRMVEWVIVPHCYIYTMEYYLAMTKKKILPFVTTWINLEGIMLNKMSQIEKDKYT